MREIARTLLLEWELASIRWREAVHLPLHWRKRSVHSGDRVLIVGPNACGKSTLLLALAGAGPRYDGRIRIRGGSFVANFTPYDRLRLGLALVSQSRGFFETLTVGTNVTLIEGRAGPPRAGPFRDWVATRSRLRLPGASGGERQKVVLERAWRSGADVLLLDEPWNALDKESNAMLDDAIFAFPGGIIAVRHVRDSCAAKSQGWSLLDFDDFRRSS